MTQNQNKQRILFLQKKCEYWQKKINLQSWKITIKGIAFSQGNHNYGADLTADFAKKEATIFIAFTNKQKDHNALVHELVHLILWELDLFCAQRIPEQDQSKYLTILEKTTTALTEAILKSSQKD